MKFKNGERKRGHTSKWKRTLIRKEKEHIHFKVKRGITRGENGAFLALKKGHSPEMKKGHLSEEKWH